MYLVTIQRHKNNNPLTGRARYRVAHVKLSANPLAQTGLIASNRDDKECYVYLPSAPKAGTFINPRKALGI